MIRMRDLTHIVAPGERTLRHNAGADDTSLQMGGRGHALGNLLLQLRGSPGHLFCVPAARTRDAPDADPAWTAGLGVRLGLRSRGSPGWHGGRSHPPEDGHSRRAARVERDLYCHGVLAHLPTPLLV